QPATPTLPTTNPPPVAKPVVTPADATSAGAAPAPAQNTSPPNSAPPVLRPGAEQPYPPGHITIEEKAKTSVMTRFGNFDLRKLRAFKWPPVDLLKDQKEKYKDLDTLKDQLKIKQKLQERCLDYVMAYEEAIRQEIGVNNFNFGTQFTVNCDIYSELIKSEPMSQTDPIFDIPNEGLIKKLDQAAFMHFTANTAGNIRRTKAVENLLKAHESSLFGLLGMPLSFSFLVTQVILVIVLCISLFLLYKKIRE
ncbi:MAG: hypothetical protein ABL930_10240, partial [Pseudobdellovibrio sp.]